MADRVLWVPLTMPGLNELLGAALRNRHVYGSMKRKWGGVVALYARTQGFPKITGPAHYEIECIEPNRRRDPDNFIGGAQKVLFDALQDEGLLENDGWEHVLSITTSWKLDKTKAGVRLTVKEA